MPNRILNEDWTDYDNKKIRDSRDARFFSCEERWEVEYLLSKIRKHLPGKTEDQIKEAIAHCCRTIHGNKPRKEFVACVMGRLQ
jgi:hypothetical protein